MDVITVLSRKGGSGKSTVAAHLGVSAGSAGLKVVEIDLDPQQSLTTWGRLREEGSFPAVLAATPERLPDIIAAARANGADLIIVDTAPHIHTPSLNAASAADIILIPTRVSLFDLAAIKTTADIVQLAKKPAYVLLNAVPVRVQAERLSQAATFAGQHGLPVCPINLHHRADYSNALDGGWAVQEHNPKGKAAREVRDLWTWTETQLRLQRDDAAARPRKRRVNG